MKDSFSPMRIAMVGSFPLDPSRIPGGVEAVIKNLLGPLAATPGLDLHLVTCVQGLDRPRNLEFRGARIHYLPGQSRLGHLTDHVLEQRRIAVKLKEIVPDLVHAHGTGQYVAGSHRSGFPVVTTVHGIRHKEVVLFGGLKGQVRRVTTIRLERRVLAESRHIFVIADYVARAIAPLTRAKLYPIANPVAPEFFALPTSDESDTILSVAAVQPRKGLLHLVEALAAVRRVRPTARLTLIGKVLDAPYAERIRSRIRELGLQNAVEMPGFVSDEELQAAFTGCAVFALCSVEESSPVSIAEAMTLGKPVVATAVGGVPDLVADGRSGYLVPFGDVPGIASALLRILDDPRRRLAFSRAARSRAEADFHPDAIAARTVAVYEEILASGKGRT